jgi:hypothetical protein
MPSGGSGTPSQLEDPWYSGPGTRQTTTRRAGEGLGPDWQVRAEVLAALLCGAVEVEPGQVGEIHLDRARIIGKLELPGATFRHRLRLNECHIADGIDLSGATTRTLNLRGCHVGAIRLDHAKINGAFNLNGAYLDSKGGPALNAQRLTVTAARGTRPNSSKDLLPLTYCRRSQSTYRV